MGCYINPKGQDKEKWLESNGRLIFAPPAWTEIPTGELPVCLVDNFTFTAAGVAFDRRELSAFSYPDNRRKRWFLVPIEKLREVSPLHLYYFGATT